MNFGDLGVEPKSRIFGLDRGLIVERYYIRRYLERHAFDVQGEVLEFHCRDYTEAFGGSRVARSHIMDLQKFPQTTIVYDLNNHYAHAPFRDALDCVIATNVLNCVHHIERAVENLHAMLKPGGVLLVSVPFVAQLSPASEQWWKDQWRVSPTCLTRLLRAFKNVEVEGLGNVLTATAMLHGISIDELPEGVLERHDPDYPVLSCGRAVK